MGMLFSMMDLDLSSPTDLGLLASAGVDTLKIEGRKKDAQYVASSVQLYRRRLDQIYGRPTLRPQAPPEARKAVGAAARRGDEGLRQDLSLSFHRGTTTFFNRGRYHENVIDLGNAGHNGVLAGRVQAVGRDGRSFTFRTDVDLERYDGLKVAPPERAFHAVPQHGRLPVDEAAAAAAGEGGLGRLMDKYANALPEFSLRQFKAEGAKAFEAPAGATVEVEVPPDVRFSAGRAIRVGDLVYQARSAELKRRVTALAAVPEEYKARAWRTVGVEVEVGEDRGAGRVTVAVVVTKLGRELVREEVVLPWEAARREGWTSGDAAKEVAELLGVYGDVGFRARDGAVAIRGLVSEEEEKEEEEEAAPVPYLPRKELKALKQRVVARLPAAYDVLIEARKAAALASLGSDTAPLPPAAWGERRFAVKVDRPEYLELLDAYLSSAPDLSGLVEEVVFEPKRMWLADTRPEEGARRLLALARKHGLRARLALPTVNRAWDLPPLRGWVQVFANAATEEEGGVACFEVGNLGAWGLLEEMGLGADNPRVDLATDFPLYALNHEATAVWARELRPSRIALSVEDDAENLRAQLARWPQAGAAEAAANRPRPQYLLYKDVPLFLAESCSLTALHGGCPGSKVCGYRTLSIENDAGERFSVAHEHCKTVVYGEEAQSLVHRQGELLAMGVRHFKLDFLTRLYDAGAFTRVLDAALRREATDRRPLPRTHVANFDRRLL
jgi:U32 family peptidase